MNNNMIYLDNAATTFPKPEEVYKAMDYANRNLAVNAGRGSYELAKKASKLIDDTRNKLLHLCSCKNADVIFSPSATAAINQILRGIKWSIGDVVYVSPYEHNAVMRTLYSLHKEKGIEIEQIAIDLKSLEVDLAKTEYLFSQKKPKMVCCTHVSNVTGYILPINDIALVAKKYEAITMVDGAQALGLVPFVLDEKLIDFYVFAGHKTLYGPFGIAGFYNINRVVLQECFTGGTGSNSLSLDMPTDIPVKYEPASPNIVAIAGLNAAITNLNIQDEYRRIMELTEYLIGRLICLEEIRAFTYLEKRQVGIVSFYVEELNSNDVGEILDQEYSIDVRTGYHCAPFIHKYLEDIDSSGTVRIGLGRFNTKVEIDKLINALHEIIE